MKWQAKIFMLFWLYWFSDSVFLSYSNLLFHDYSDPWYWIWGLMIIPIILLIVIIPLSLGYIPHSEYGENKELKLKTKRKEKLIKRETNPQSSLLSSFTITTALLLLGWFYALLNINELQQLYYSGIGIFGYSILLFITLFVIIFDGTELFEILDGGIE